MATWPEAHAPYLATNYQPYGEARCNRLAWPVGPLPQLQRDGVPEYTCTKPKWQSNQYPFKGVSSSEGDCACDLNGSVDDSILLLEGYSNKSTPCVKDRLQANIAYLKQSYPLLGRDIPFTSVPEGKWFKNHSLRSVFVAETVSN